MYFSDYVQIVWKKIKVNNSIEEMYLELGSTMYHTTKRFKLLEISQREHGPSILTMDYETLDEIQKSVCVSSDHSPTTLKNLALIFGTPLGIDLKVNNY